MKFKPGCRVDADEWTCDGEKISDPAKLAAIKKVLVESGPVLLDHSFLRGGRGSRTMVFEDYEELITYLTENARAGDHIAVWSLWPFMRDTPPLAQGKLVGHSMTHTKGELETFQAAIQQHVKPLAARYELSFVEIDPELYALVAPNFYIKFYCAGGHGFSFTITVGSSFVPVWNTEDERGFPWLARYAGKQTWAHTRHENVRAFAQEFADLAALLPAYLELLRTATPSYWESFHRFVAQEIARQPETDSMGRPVQPGLNETRGLP